MITCKHFPFDILNEFSSRDIDYQLNPERFQDFIAHTPSLKNFPRAIEERRHKKVDRELLVTVIEEQYTHIKMTETQKSHVQNLLNKHCFTIVTAHQPSLLTGPLYFIYKIISAISLARQAEQKFTDFSFVPVFVLGGEDHDFAEINHARLFNKNLVWENDEAGSVGRMSLDTLKDVLLSLKEILGNSSHASELLEMIDSSFASSSTYAEFMHAFVNKLLGEYGVIVLNMDHRAFKTQFIPVMEKELKENTSYPLVLASQEKIETLGYKPQAHAREINLFYLLENARERIIYENGRYAVLNTDLSFTEDELIDHLKEHPENFSPNVVLRPLFQESILPNLVYIGGGGELAYWMERKTQFNAFGIFYPLLYRRDSVLWINKKQEKMMEDFAISIESLLSYTEDELVTNFVKSNADVELDFTQEEGLLKEAFDMLVEKANNIDVTLAKAIKGEEVKQNKAFHQLAGRLIRSLKHKQENELNKIRKLKQDLFPGNGLQERTDNFIPYYLKYGKHYFELLLSALNPEDKSLKVIIED
jgi:bacillithiol biosynthesis cysteine-adding enzyme BshC